MYQLAIIRCDEGGEVIVGYTLSRELIQAYLSWLDAAGHSDLAWACVQLMAQADVEAEQHV